MVSASRRWHRRIVYFCYIVTFLWATQTAVAQSSLTGSVTGTVHNGTTDDAAPEGTEVTLHAYNSSYTAAETMTTTLDADGRFHFTLDNKPSDWVYMVSTEYEELSFSSTIAPLTNEAPLNLSITVYKTTSDPTNIVIDQLSISLTTVGQEVQVSELYTFANMGTAVFTGNSDQGTVQMTLPTAAEAPTFERGMGPNSGFFPANEIIQQDGRWLDTIPLRPGPNSLTLRINYSLPATGLDLSRTLPYQTNTVFLAVSDGLEFATDGWQQQATQSAGERGAMLRFAQEDIAAGSALPLAFSAAVSPVGRTNSFTASPVSDWVLSLAILLLVTTIAFRLLRPGSRQTAVPQLATSAGPTLSSNGSQDQAERFQLLFALADLDSAYKSGKVSEVEYQNQRQEIKNRLRSIWEVA
jgi:hypothetical protein